MLKIALCVFPTSVEAAEHFQSPCKNGQVHWVRVARPWEGASPSTTTRDALCQVGPTSTSASEEVTTTDLTGTEPLSKNACFHGANVHQETRTPILNRH
jgi:hypothetical protein